MDTPPSTPELGPADQGPTGGGGEWVPALASGSEAQEQATPDWDPAPLPAGGPRRGDQELSRLGLRLEGGYLRSWDAVLPGDGQGEGGGLGADQDPGRGGPLLGDRRWRDAQVRELWTVEESVPWQWWMEMDTDPAH